MLHHNVHHTKRHRKLYNEHYTSVRMTGWQWGYKEEARVSHLSSSSLNFFSQERNRLRDNMTYSMIFNRFLASASGLTESHFTWRKERGRFPGKSHQMGTCPSSKAILKRTEWHSLWLEDHSQLKVPTALTNKPLMSWDGGGQAFISYLQTYYETLFVILSFTVWLITFLFCR